MKLARRRSGSGNDDDRILPLINVVFLLLIFFMVVGSLSATDPFQISPPTSVNGDAGDPKDVVLLIGADGRPALAALGLKTLAEAPRLTLRERQTLGGDAYALWSCAF